MKELIEYLQTFDQPPFLLLPKSLKKDFLLQIDAMNCFNPCHLIDEDSLVDKIDSIALIELFQHFNINYYLGMRILTYLPYISLSKVYHSDKLIDLQNYKRHLFNQGYVDIVNLDRFQNQNIVVAYNPFSINNIKNAKIFSFSPKKNGSFSVEATETDDEFSQAHAVIDKIYRLIKNGTDINNISIVNASNDDLWLLKKEALFYGFSIQPEENIPLDSQNSVIQFMKDVRTMPVEKALSIFSDNIDSQSPYALKAYLQLIEIIQTYGINYLETDKQLLLFLIVQKKIHQPAVKNAVKIITFNDAFVHLDEHYFVMNYTDTLFPIYDRDDDYLRDKEKEEAELITSIEKNQLMLSNLINRLKSLNHLNVFFPKKIKGNYMRKCEIISDEAMINIKYNPLENNLSGSMAYDLLQYQKKKYVMNHYGKIDDDFSSYQATFKLLNKTYRPEFKSLDSHTVKRLLSNGFNFSPTNLERFNACRFRFLLDYLLKILTEEPSDSILFGNIAHEILSKIINTDASINDLKNQFIEKLEKPLTPKMKVHLDLFVNRLEKVVEYLNKMEKASAFVNEGFEMELKAEISKHPQFFMKGKIDRVLSYESNNKKYYSVIDYKTGTKTFSFDSYEKGIDIQPLFYLNLLKKTNDNPGFVPFGFFYQGVNIKRLNMLPNGQELEKALKMNGVALSDSNIVKKFAPNLNISCFRLKNDGVSFYTTDKLVSFEKMEEMVASIDMFIRNAIEKMNAGDFSINPIPGKDDFDDSPSCQYCPHASVCYLANQYVSEENQELLDMEEE